MASYYKSIGRRVRQRNDRKPCEVLKIERGGDTVDLPEYLYLFWGELLNFVEVQAARKKIITSYKIDDERFDCMVQALVDKNLLVVIDMCDDSDDFDMVFCKDGQTRMVDNQEYRATRRVKLNGFYYQEYQAIGISPGTVFFDESDKPVMDMPTNIALRERYCLVPHLSKDGHWIILD